MNMKKLACLFLTLCLLLPHASWANRAEVLLLPTRVVMENGDRFTTVVVKNTGNATGNFSVGLVDMEMKDDGQVTPVDPAKPDPYSAIPYIRIAPKSITLKPGETQNVRIMVRKPETLPAGEYRSHLRVSLDNDNVDNTPDSAADPLSQGKKPEAHIAVKANLVLIIPVILRNGDTTLNMKLEEPKVTYDAKGVPALTLAMLREGTRSSMGDFTITYAGADGHSQLIKTFPGVPVYRPLTKRTVSIPLDDIPKGTDLNHGKLEIVYTSQGKDGAAGEKLAETQLSLSGH
jgi:hypothetical protein